MEQFEEFQSPKSSPVFLKRSFETEAEAICNYMVEGSALSFTGRLLDGILPA
jgi:hypothetical protein